VSDPASVLISTASLLAVAVMAGAVGSLRADVQELRRARPDIEALRVEHARDVAALRAEHEKARAKDRAALVSVRLVVRRLDRHVRRLLGAPLPPEEPEPAPLGFRPPP
jgi:hypothetical protein